MDWDEILQQRQNEYPYEVFIRFVAHNFYGKSAYFLDLGSGSGANAKFLRDHGFNVLAVDASQYAKADLNCNIESLVFPPECFDCVYDLGTLQYLDQVDYEDIADWLKPGGKFFSISNRPHWRAYKAFSDHRHGWYEYPDRGNQISHWVIEADK